MRIANSLSSQLVQTRSQIVSTEVKYTPINSKFEAVIIKVYLGIKQNLHSK